MTFPHFAAIRQRPWNSRRFFHPRLDAELSDHADPGGAAHARLDRQGDADEGGSGRSRRLSRGSSASLAWGGAQAVPPRRVHSYDRFRFDEKTKFQFLYRKGHGFAAGEDALPTFRHFTKPVAASIEAHPGDVLQAGWGKDPIAILFIDLSKTKALNDHLLATFFPALVPGSVIVQQDFLFFRNPWLYPTMRALEGSVEMLAHTDQNSVVFGVHRTPTAGELQACTAARTSFEATVAAIEHFRGKFTDLRQIEMIDALMASLKAVPDADKAWLLPNVAALPAIEEDA